jgi:capsular polysaccharide biosynthesis protein
LDLEGIDFNVNIKVSSMSPIDLEDDKNRFLEFMAIINNYPQIALSPTLIREAAERVGFNTNEKVLRELQDMALLAQMQLKQQTESALAQRTVAGATPNANEKITNQLENQVGLPTQ